MTVIMSAIQEQLKTLTSAQTNQVSPKRKFYWWICGSNFNHGSKTCLAKKAGHKEEAYYKKRMGGSDKGCEWRLGAIVNKIEIINLKISLINHINTPHSPTSTNMLAVADYGANIHIARQSTPTMAPVIMDNEIKSRLPYGSTMVLTHIATLQLPGLRN